MCVCVRACVRARARARFTNTLIIIINYFCGQDLFAVLMFAQTVAAISQIWVLGIPARLAAVWFGPEEVSTATSLGVFGNQVSFSSCHRAEHTNG